MRAHYRAPSADALKEASRSPHPGRRSTSAHAERSSIRFEGSTTTSNDYQAPPPEFWQRLERAVVDAGASAAPAPLFARFEGESSMRAHYQAPSPDSLRMTHEINSVSRERVAAPVRFEGESTMHHDYPVPPLEDLRKLIPGISSGSQSGERKIPPAAFEGESSMRAHYRAPSADALKEASRSPHPGRRSTSAHAERSSIRFEGSTTTSNDYQAPPPEFWQRLERAVVDAGASAAPAPLIARFEGESSMREHYQAPPPDSLRMTHEINSVSREHVAAPVRFEGESTMHHDYPVPPLEDLRKLIPGTSSGSQSGERKIPPAAFEGESSMRAHYRAPSADAYMSCFAGCNGRPTLDTESGFPARHVPAWAVVPRSFRETEATSQSLQGEPNTVASKDGLREIGTSEVSQENCAGHQGDQSNVEVAEASRYQPRLARQQKQSDKLET